MDLRTLIRLLRERGFTKDGEAILRLLDQEIRRVMDLVRGMLDVVDPDTCPEDLLDFLASLFGVPFLPSAPLAEKLEFLQQAILTTVPADDFPALADILGVDLSAYPTVDEQRLALYEATRTATEEQIDRCLYTIDAGYLLGVMTPAQKRLALKQAISWYRVRGTELSYQILLRVFGLSARIIPLWTENYQSFWEEPQGPTVFEGGTWYPTPHYALEFHRWSDRGAVSTSIINLYTQLVREEVQPIQCVLTRVSFIQELTDTVSFTDEVVVDLSLPTLDIVYWPYCEWQDKGLVFIPEPRRDQITATRGGESGGSFYDSILLFGIGRGVGDWNDWAAAFWDDSKRRDSFQPGYIYVEGHFRRDDPRGPKWYLSLGRGGTGTRGGVLLVVPEGSVPEDAEIILAGGKVYVNGEESDLPLTFFRDPDTCDNRVDFIKYGGVWADEDRHCYPYPRSVHNPPKRGEGLYDRGGICVLADDYVAVVLPLADEDTFPVEEGVVEYHAWADFDEVFCEFIWLRNGQVEFDRSGFDFRLCEPLQRDGHLTEHVRSGSPYDRHGICAWRRDGSLGLDRTAYSFDPELAYFTRDDYRCYPDEAKAGLVSGLVDEFPVDDQCVVSVLPVETEDTADVDEADFAGTIATRETDKFCPHLVLRDGTARFDRGLTCSYEWRALCHCRSGSDYPRDGSAGDRSDRATERQGIRYRAPYEQERLDLTEFLRGSGLPFTRAGAGWDRDGSLGLDRTVYAFEECLRGFFHRGQPYCVEDFHEISITPEDVHVLPLETDDLLHVDVAEVRWEDEDTAVASAQDPTDLWVGYAESYCGETLRCGLGPCPPSVETRCEPVHLTRDGASGVHRSGLEARLTRIGWGIRTVYHSAPCRGEYEFVRLACAEPLRCGAPFERDGTENRGVTRCYLDLGLVRDGSVLVQRDATDLSATVRRRESECVLHDNPVVGFTADAVDAFPIEGDLEAAFELVPTADAGPTPAESDWAIAADIPFEERPYGYLRDDPRLGCREPGAVTRCEGHPDRVWDLPRLLHSWNLRDTGYAALYRSMDAPRFIGVRWRWEGPLRDGSLTYDRSGDAAYPYYSGFTRASYLELAEDWQPEPITVQFADEASIAPGDVHGCDFSLAVEDTGPPVLEEDWAGLENWSARDQFCAELRLRDGTVRFTRGYPEDSIPLRWGTYPRVGWDWYRGVDYYPEPRDYQPAYPYRDAPFARDGSERRFEGFYRDGSLTADRSAGVFWDVERRSVVCYTDDFEVGLVPVLVDTVVVEDEWTGAFELDTEPDAYPYVVDEDPSSLTYEVIGDHFSGAPLRYGTRRMPADRDCSLDPPRLDPDAPTRGTAVADRTVWAFSVDTCPRRDWPVVVDDLDVALTELSLTDPFPVDDYLGYERDYGSGVEMDLSADGAPEPMEEDWAGSVSPEFSENLWGLYARDGAAPFHRSGEGEPRRFRGYRASYLCRGPEVEGPRAVGDVAGCREMDVPRDGSLTRWAGPWRDGSYGREASWLLEAQRRGASLPDEDWSPVVSPVLWEDTVVEPTDGWWAGTVSTWEDTGPTAADSSSAEASASLAEDFCPRELTRGVAVGVRSCGVYFRYDGHPDRDWLARRPGLCDEPYRDCGYVALERTMETPRDGSLMRWDGALRDGADDWRRDDILLCDRYRRREITCYAEEYEFQFSPYDLGEDEFRCFSPVLRETDWIRDGSFDCFYRDGTNCCGPWDTLEIIIHRCQEWDSPSCYWDQPGVNWDPI